VDIITYIGYSFRIFFILKIFFLYLVEKTIKEVVKFHFHKMSNKSIKSQECEKF